MPLAARNVPDLCWCPGAGPTAIVRVSVAARVVAIQVRNTCVAGVVVVAAATGDALTIGALAGDLSNHGMFPFGPFHGARPCTGLRGMIASNHHRSSGVA